MIKQAGAIYKHCKDHCLPFRLWRIQKNCSCKQLPFLLTFPNTKDALHLTLQVSSVTPQASQLSGTLLTKTYIKYPGLGVCRTWVKYLFHQRVTHDYLQLFIYLFILFSLLEAPFHPQLKINSKWNKWTNEIYEFLLQKWGYWNCRKSCVSCCILRWAKFRSIH